VIHIFPNLDYVVQKFEKRKIYRAQLAPKVLSMSCLSSKLGPLIIYIFLAYLRLLLDLWDTGRLSLSKVSGNHNDVS
jgi:hypothetical protein